MKRYCNNVTELVESSDRGLQARITATGFGITFCHVLSVVSQDNVACECDLGTLDLVDFARSRVTVL